MNPKALVPLALAVVLGLAAAFLVRTAMSHKQAVVIGPGNLVGVVVAKQDADPGHALGPEDVTVAQVPAETAPAGAVFSDPGQLAGRVTAVPLVKGQVVCETLLAPVGSASGLAAVVPTGMRAMTLEVSEYSGVGGMLEPGCHVDVMCIVHDERSKQTACRTVLQNIRVSAVGRSISPPRPAAGQPPPPPSNSVTLLCDPKQAQTLELATSTGRPWLVLRSGKDGAVLPVEGTTLAELTGNPDGPADPVVDPTTVATDTPAAPTAPAMVPAAPTAKAATPTTKPADPAIAAATDVTPAPARVPATVRRTITFINGGVESHVAIDVANPRALSTTTDAVALPDTGDATSR